LIAALIAAPSISFNVEEATIAQIHDAIKGKRLTCVALVDAYLARIALYDRQSPALNAITVVNPKARAEAEDKDRLFARRGLTGPLHCVPMVVKDNFETIGLQSADGTITLAGFVSDRDAFQVKRIKEAGAIVLAKTNMGEFAFSPLETLNSLQGHTRNPYAPDRVPAGSSGGTAAAVASSFAAAGLGSDTGNSIRGPSAHTALVGIRSTMGLTSRAGVIPLNTLADIAGPMARTVTDAVTIFQIIAGEDPEDPATTRSRRRTIPDYRKSLDRDGLKNARIGILRQAYERQNQPGDEEVSTIFARALDDMKAAGAAIVDDVKIEDVPRPASAAACRGFKYDLNEYLATRGRKAPVHSLEEILASPLFAQIPAVSQQRLRQASTVNAEGPDSDACKAETSYRAAFAASVGRTMDTLKLDALVYPTWSHPPRLITDQAAPTGDNSQVYAPRAGFPALTVPMGYTRDGRLPAGVTFLGRAWDEGRIFRLAFAYEQKTKHRKPPRLP
jgi:Asp-tRNA(Asn)/Glu-tRNA(Gln) amidotransferase A subunit family amidase